jgi:hypothetical protein
MLTDGRGFRPSNVLSVPEYCKASFSAYPANARYAALAMASDEPERERRDRRRKTEHGSYV